MPISQSQHIELLEAAQAYHKALTQFQRRITAIITQALADEDYKYAVKEIALHLNHGEQFRPAELSKADSVLQVELFRYTPQRQKENDYQRERKRIQRQRRADELTAQGLPKPIPRNTVRPPILQEDDPLQYDDDDELTPEAAKVLEDDPEFREYLEGKRPTLTPKKGGT